MRTSDKVAAQFNDNDRRDSLHDKITVWTQEHASYIYYEINKKYIRDGDDESNLMGVLDKLTCIWEAPLTVGRNRIGGYVDLLITYRGGVSLSASRIGCEIKPSITSIGDVIRQIQYYRTLNFEDWPIQEFCVVSPDDRYAKIFEDQGIRFIKYTP